MDYEYALNIANDVVDRLKPHCERIEIAGSVRRKKPINIHDIEIVAIPKPYEVDLFASGIALVIPKWEKVKGELPCKYTQRIHESGAKLDIFFATPENWGFMFAVRTGNASFSKHLGKMWVKYGYKGVEGNLMRSGKKIAVREEVELFKMLGLKYVEPEERNWGEIK